MKDKDGIENCKYISRGITHRFSFLPFWHVRWYSLVLSNTNMQHSLLQWYWMRFLGSISHWASRSETGRSSTGSWGGGWGILYFLYISILNFLIIFRIQLLNNLPACSCLCFRLFCLSLFDTTYILSLCCQLFCPAIYLDSYYEFLSRCILLCDLFVANIINYQEIFCPNAFVLTSLKMSVLYPSFSGLLQHFVILFHCHIFETLSRRKMKNQRWMTMETRSLMKKVLGKRKMVEIIVWRVERLYNTAMQYSIV